MVLSLGIEDIQYKIETLESGLYDTSYPSWIDVLMRMLSGMKYGEDQDKLISKNI
jgi:hypothetical protein